MTMDTLELHTQEQDRAFRASQTVFADPYAKYNTKKTTTTSNKTNVLNPHALYDRKSIEAKRNFLEQLLGSPSDSFFHDSMESSMFSSSVFPTIEEKDEQGHKRTKPSSYLLTRNESPLDGKDVEPKMIRSPLTKSNVKRKIHAEALFGSPVTSSSCKGKKKYSDIAMVGRLDRPNKDSRRRDSLLKRSADTDLAISKALLTRHETRAEFLVNRRARIQKAKAPSARDVMWNVVPLPAHQENYFHTTSPKTSSSSKKDKDDSDGEANAQTRRYPGARTTSSRALVTAGQFSAPNNKTTTTLSLLATMNIVQTPTSSRSRKGRRHRRLPSI